MKANIELVLCVVIFSLYISIVGFYHQSPLSELDNYYRFLLLLPLLLIPFNESHIVKLICICAAAGLTHAVYSNAFAWEPTLPFGAEAFSYWLKNTRYMGTSNTSITYASLCATLFMISLYFILYKNNKTYYIVSSAVIFFLLFMLTGTRGPILGIILASSYLIYVTRRDISNKLGFIKPILFLFIFLISIVIIPNPVGERLKHLNQINFTDPLSITHVSLRERVYYFVYGLDEIKYNYHIGIGPQNLENRMSLHLNEQAIINSIAPKNHLHNDFLDIVLKFGFMSLILLFFIYFFIINKKNKENSILLSILMLMLVSSQITQSQFAHHQAITFFIALFYLLQVKTNSKAK